jgi:hypothetical protein
VGGRQVPLVTDRAQSRRPATDRLVAVTHEGGLPRRPRQPLVAPAPPMERPLCTDRQHHPWGLENCFFSPVKKYFLVDITNINKVEGGECLKLFVPEENAVKATKLKDQEEQEGKEGGTSLVGHPVLTPGLEGQAQEGCSCVRGERRGGGIRGIRYASISPAPLFRFSFSRTGSQPERHLAVKVDNLPTSCPGTVQILYCTFILKIIINYYFYIIQLRG